MEEGRGRKKESLWSQAHSEDRPVPTTMATAKASSESLQGQGGAVVFPVGHPFPHR